LSTSRYIGCQRVDDPDHPAGPWRYYQARFWARVELLRWDPQHEIDERRLVRPEDFLQTLSWGSAPHRSHHPGGRAQGRSRTRTRLTALTVRHAVSLLATIALTWHDAR